MHADHDVFLQAIKNKNKVRVLFLDNKGSMEARLLIPLDYNPGRRATDKSDCYYFWDSDIGAGGSPLMFLSDQIHNMEMDKEQFNPADFVDIAQDMPHLMRSFFVKRDWGGHI